MMRYAICRKLADFRSNLSQIERSEWVTCALPMFVALSIIVSTGPMLQKFIFSLGTTRAPSVYEAAMGVGIIEFPSFLEWLGWSADPAFMTISFFITLIAFRHNHVRDFGISAGITAFLLIFSYDIILGILNKEVDFEYFATNLFSDIIGSVFIVILTSIFLTLRIQTITNINKNARILSGMLYIVLSIVISCALYVITSTLYQPTTVRFEAEMATPVSGYLSSRAPISEKALGVVEKRENVQKLDSRFSFLPLGSTSERVRVENSGNDMTTIFKSSDNKFPYSLRIGVISNCYGIDSILKKSETLNMWNVANVTDANISIKHSELMNFYSLNEMKIEYIQDNLSYYVLNTKKSDKITKLIVQESIDKKDIIKLSEWDVIKFAVSASLISNTKNAVETNSAMLEFKTNVGTFNFKLKSGKLHRAGKIGICSDIEKWAPPSTSRHFRSDLIHST